MYVLAAVLIGGAFVYLAVLRIRSKSGLGMKRDLDDFELLEVSVPRVETDDSGGVQASALAAENMFAALHGLLREDLSLQEHFSLEIASVGGEGLRFYFAVPKDILKFVESQIYAQYPDCQIKIVEDYTQRVSPDFFEIASLTLSKEQYFPIKTFRDIEVDPLSGVTSTLSELHAGERVWIQILVRPTPDGWQKEGSDYVRNVREGTDSSGGGLFSGFGKFFMAEMKGLFENIILFGWLVRREPDAIGKPSSFSTVPRLSAMQDLELTAIENKLSRMGFEVEMRVMSESSTSAVRVESNLRALLASLKQFSSTALNSFTSGIVPNKISAFDQFKRRSLGGDDTFVLTSEELATIFHLPSSHIETPDISWVLSKKSEPPAGLPIKDCCYIGETIYRSRKVTFGIKEGDDRLRHLYIIGKSGTGKSSLFETMFSQDMAKGHGVGLLDPHGETIDKVLERIPDDRVEDVIYFDPSDTEYPLGFNLMELNDPSQKNLMASALVAAIKHNFDYSWGPRLEYLLNYAILTLLEVPGTTMLGITRLLEDDNYRKFILHFVKDPVIVRFWETEFKNMKGNQKLVTEAIAPIQNKVNRFLASTTIRNILGQPKSTVDIWWAMNEGKILLINLSKGKIGSDNSNLLGALLVSRIQSMALQRAKLPPEERRPFYLYVDEFQNFATGSFEEILSESRKYKLGLYLTNQFTAQLSEELQSAVFGNVGTVASFSVGAADAHTMAYEFAPYFDETDVISLEKFQIYVRLMIDGMTSHPFMAKTITPWADETGKVVPPKTSNKERVLELSRQKYSTPREAVEKKINKWVEAPFDKGMAIALEMGDKAKKSENT